MSAPIGSHHDWHCAEYVQDWIAQDTTRDQQRRPLLGKAAALLPLPRNAPARVLDIGGGYGEFTAQVLTEFPAATVCLQDYSAPMIEQARTRLAPFGDRVHYVHSDLRDPEWVTGVGGPFDAVVSALTIHNLGTESAIRPLYSQLHVLLRPGGWFFDVDLVLDVLLGPADAPLATLYAANRGPSGARQPNHHDTTGVSEAPGLEQRLRWLRDAGFDAVDCVWKQFAEVFLAAHRAP